MAAKACLLMHLPVEVRLVIYRYLFSNADTIKLDVNDAGYIYFTDLAKIHLASLRTCRRIYLEACPLLYGINTFAITFKDVHRLAKMHQASSLCIENLVVQSVMPMGLPRSSPNPVYPTNVAFTTPLPMQLPHIPDPDANAPPHEVLELGTIGTALGGLRRLSINPSSASTFLATVLQLSRSLPCSPIRDWPVLEVIVHVKQHDHGAYVPGCGLSLSGEHQNLIRADSRLSALTEASTLGLGQEMPDLKVIRVDGCLSWDHCQLIQDHKSSYGDCAFEKEIILNSMAEGHNDSEYRYTWHRVDDDEQQAKARKAAVNMHQWVPRLSDEDYGKVLASFGAELKAVQYTLPQNPRAKRRRGNF